MLFSYKLLSQLVSLSDYTPESLRERLTAAGFEVEGLTKMAQADHLILGHVLTCEKHPDSDHLHCLKVDCGKDVGILSIVCGAPNAREGLNVIVALPGAVLPAKGVTIQKGLIRGQESNGMCCSLTELGVDPELLSEAQVNGIEELPANAPIGETHVLAYLGLDDSILDINVLPNRPDCFSYLGMAREISSLTGAKLSPVPLFNPAKLPEGVEVSSLSERCPRFDVLSLSDIVPKKATPMNIQRALIASGIRPLSPIVDLGNYSMLLTGEPLNLYDADKNPARKYVARDDYEGKFTAFDGKEYDLIRGDLVITDGEKPLCLAGIMAGKDSAISAGTKNIDIEAAVFYHASIRHTSNRLGLASASEQLFAKERNPLMIPEALAVTLALLPLFFESYHVVGYRSFNAVDETRKSFPFSLERLNHRLGSDYTEEEVNDVFKAYRIQRKGNLLTAPIDRVDLLEQCDIDEEVFRYYGYERIHPTLEHLPITLGKRTEEQEARFALQNLLIGRGFDEILTYTLLDEKADQSLRVFSHDPSYRILNPMTKDHEYVRSDLLPSLLETIRYNESHQHSDFRLFEISPIDTPKGNHLYLSLALIGNLSLTENFGSRPYTFLDLKGIVEALLAKLGLTPSRYRLEYSKNPAFHPGASADLYVGKTLAGTFGKLHPEVSKDEDLVGELDLGFLLSLKSSKTHFEPYSSFPTVRRDLSFRKKADVSYERLKRTIREVKNAYLLDVALFDDFKDPQTGEEYLGVSLTLGKEDGTLKDSEITAALGNVETAVKTQLGLTLRGE